MIPRRRATCGPLRLRLLVAAGGVLGATLRLGAITAAGDGRAWLWLVIGLVNVLGCAVVGATLATAERRSWPTHWRLAVTVGVCGGLTTFSTVAVEVALAFDHGAGTAAAAIGWAVLSLTLGIGAVILGRRVVTRRLTLPAGEA